MSKALELEGKRFGNLVVQRRVENDKRSRCSRWLCKCDCGKEVIMRGYTLTSGHSKSCGCKNVEATIKRQTKHGLPRDRLYTIWKNMRQRCNNPNSQDYNIYGGRGIKICEEWNDYSVFHKWALNNGYSQDRSIDRINVNSGYSPNNCRWATSLEQGNNTRTNRFIEIDGEVHTVAEWARIKGLRVGVIRCRLHSGWDERRAIMTPLMKNYSTKQGK